MGKNKLKKFAEMAEMANVFEADFDCLRADSFALKGKWREEYFGNDRPIVVELGCGRGEYTVGLAKLFPQKNFIGIDIKGARMHSGAKQALDEGLRNVAFVRTRIELSSAIFAAGEVDELWITFPDPQMQKARKRLIGTMLLTQYRRFLKADALVHLKTDSAFLFAYTVEMLKANAIVPEVAHSDLYASGTDDPSLAIKTYCELKWLAHEKTIKYIKFHLPHALSLVEPEVEIEHDTYHSVGRGVKEYAQ